MRNGDDHLRQYTPLVQRIIIVVAVLTAIPVILWAVTGFVSSYVGPTRAPSYRPTAITMPTQEAASTPANETAAQPVTLSDPLPSVSEAKASMMDSRTMPPAVNGQLGDRIVVGDNRAPANARAAGAVAVGPAATVVAVAPGAAQPALPPVPRDGAAPSLSAFAAQQPRAADEPSADDTAAAKPLSGPIPLPRHRPRHFAMAEPAAPSAGTPAQGQAASPKGAPKTAVPMPRPRPDAAGPAVATDTATPGPLDWIQGLFQQH